MKYRLFIIIILTIPFVGISQTFNSLNSLQLITDVSATDADSILINEGFQNSSIVGLKFTYQKKSENLVLQTSPRQITYTFSDKAAYMKINSDASKEGYVLTNEAEVITHNNKPKTVSSFEKDAIKISFGTDLNTSTKITTYYVSITNSNPEYQRVAEKVEVKKEPEVIKETQIEAEKSKKQPLLLTTLKPKTSSTKPTTTITATPNDSTIALKKTRKTIGASLYKTTYNTYSEVLFNLQFGAEISRAKYMKQKNKFFVDTRIDLDASIFLDMQKYYPSTYQTMYLTKYYFSLGMISEIRKKKNSFLMSVGPALNWTTGKIEDVGRASFITPALHMGEYIQRHFGTSKLGQDKMFVRLGFDQYFSMKGGYIGSFGLTLGF